LHILAYFRQRVTSQYTVNKNEYLCTSGITPFQNVYRMWGRT